MAKLVEKATQDATTAPRNNMTKQEEGTTMDTAQALKERSDNTLFRCFDQLHGENLSANDLTDLIAKAYLAGKAAGLSVAMARLDDPSIDMTPDAKAACRKISAACRAAGEACLIRWDGKAI